MKRIARGLLSLSCLSLALVGVSVAGASTTRSSLVPYRLVRAGNSDVVYVITWSGCKQAKCLGLYRSNVEATTFTKVELPPGTSFETLGDVVFATPLIGYATLGSYSPSTLYATKNGGRTWRKVMSEDDVAYRVITTSNEVVVSSMRCIPRTDDCGQYTVQRASLAATHWVTLRALWRTGNRKDEQIYGPSLAAFGKNVWELETASSGNFGVAMWASHNFGRTFSRTTPKFPQLVSVAGCSFYPMSSLTLWAECPTGMEVSFWHSSDGGVLWTQVSQTQFAGTGGGAFDPVSATVAYLDYGGVVGKVNFVRLSDGGGVAQPVAEVRCTNASLVFTTVDRGLMMCNENDTQVVLRVTNDGGTVWTPVATP
jgi:hypothetical protein